MESGRLSDTALVIAMLGLVAVVGVVLLGSVWLGGRTEQTPLDQALERQPAELVSQPDEFTTNATSVDDRPPDCAPGPVELMALDVGDGSTRWRHQVPPVSGLHSAFAVISNGSGGHVAVTFDERLGERPPSVLALDANTGQPVWQRFVAAESIHPELIGPESIVLSLEPEHNPETGNDSGVTFLTVDGAGQTRSHPSTVTDDGFGIGPEPGQELTRFSHTFPISPLLDDRSDRAGLIRDTTHNEFGLAAVEIIDPLSGQVLRLDDLPLEGDFNTIGSETSPGEPVQVGPDHILVVIGSSFGPNTRLAVLDRTNGSLRWTMDHTRAAAMAGDNILYDKRNEEPVDAASTRDLFLVDGSNPERELWSTALAVNQDGGNGFLGTVDGDLVFAVAPDAAGDGDNGAGLEFLIIDDPDDVPELITAAEGYGSGPSGRHHVDPDVLAAAAPSGVLVQPVGGDTVLVETENPPIQVTRVGDRLLVAGGQAVIGCG